MFKRLTKQLIKELGSDRRLIPVTSQVLTDSFQPLSLVTKEQPRFPWNTRKYSPSPFKLADVLEKGAEVEIELKHSEPLLFSANICHKSGAKLNLKIQTAAVDIGGLGSACLSSSLVAVRKTYVDTRELWKMVPSLSLLQQLYPKLHFYVVTEAFEIMEPLLIEETVQAGGKGTVTAAEILTIQGLSTTVKKNAMLIPRGTVLAYVVEKLQTYDEELVLLCQRLQTKLVSSLTYDAFQDELGSSLTAVQQVKDAVKEAYEPLALLSQPLRKQLLESFEVFLQDGEVASTVQSMLELSMAGNSVDHSMLESLNEEHRPSVEKLLSYLGISQDTESAKNQDLWGPVNFLCSSIDDLDYEMLPLLDTILEKKKMAQQLEMMDGILEWILFGDEGSDFEIPHHSFKNEEIHLAIEMLQTCGLDLEAGKDSTVCLWSNEARSELAALYSSLYALQILSG
uniref:gasdermin-C4-like n=1 Tax=Podarcis muralis TaxID=64176 RepID=UPI00109F5BEF|nr:gasdermin-C4-like [Podarcis muralis]